MRMGISEDYGEMMAYSDAIGWAEECAPDKTGKYQVWARMLYERDRTMPVKPKFSKGQCGRKYDSWICGKCGRWGLQVTDNYCPNCGFRIGWGPIRCMTGDGEEEGQDG